MQPQEFVLSLNHHKYTSNWWIIWHIIWHWLSWVLGQMQFLWIIILKLVNYSLFFRTPFICLCWTWIHREWTLKSTESDKSRAYLFKTTYRKSRLTFWLAFQPLTFPASLFLLFLIPSLKTSKSFSPLLFIEKCF